MAAAALSRSRGVAGTTKSLLFNLLMLCLVCLASSRIDKDKLEKLKQKLDKSQQQLDLEKAGMATTAELMSYYMSLMDPLTALVKKASEGLPEDFPPLEGLMGSLKGLMEKTKTYIDEQNEELEEEIENTEQKLREMRILIKLLEEQEAEL